MAQHGHPRHNPDRIIALAVRKAGSNNSPAEATDMNHLLLNLYIKLHLLIDREDGQDMVEYALMVASIALAAVAGIKSLALGLNTAYSNISVKLLANVT